MANVSQTGFRPHLTVGGETVQVMRRRIASGNGTAIFLHDCMKQTAAGLWGLATAGAGLSGVSTGASYFDAAINGRREAPYVPPSTSYSATAFDDHGETDQSFVYITSDP